MSAQVAPDKLDELVHVLEDMVTPAARAQPGFQGVLTLADRATGKGMMITLWETAADLTAGETSGYLGRQLAAVAPWLLSPAVRETYEVTIHF
jgi:heme-degrading monooxygenase HmoA